VAKGRIMAGDIKIEASVRAGSVELEASYPEYAIIDAGFDEPFRQQLVEKYESLAQTQTNRDCILSITAKVAGSQVVKGIFELYKVVHARSGILICANYPPEYIRALSDLGLPSLPGFELCSSLEEARTKMEKLRHEAGA
jgi:hypothetical protein